MQGCFATRELLASPLAPAGAGLALPLSIFLLLMTLLLWGGKRGHFMGCLGVDTGSFGSFEEVQGAAQFRAAVPTMRCFKTRLERWFTTFHWSRKGKTHRHNPGKNPAGHNNGAHLLLARRQLQNTTSGLILLVFTNVLVPRRSM